MQRKANCTHVYNSLRFNNRKDADDFDRFKLLLSQIVGKRMTYAQLIGKEGETEPASN